MTILKAAFAGLDRALEVAPTLGMCLFGTPVLAQIPSGQEVIEEVELGSPLSQISLFGDTRVDMIARIEEPMTLNFSLGRVEVLLDAARLTGRQTAGSRLPAAVLVGVPVLSSEEREPAPYFRTLSSAGCLHEGVAFFRKSVGGRTEAFYAVRASLNQDPMTTTWDNDLDHATGQIRLYALKVETNEGVGPPFKISFVQTGPSRKIQPSCTPFASTTAALALIRDHSDVLGYPAPSSDAE